MYNSIRPYISCWIATFVKQFPCRQIVNRHGGVLATRGVAELTARDSIMAAVGAGGAKGINGFFAEGWQLISANPLDFLINIDMQSLLILCPTSGFVIPRPCRRTAVFRKES